MVAHQPVICSHPGDPSPVLSFKTRLHQGQAVSSSQAFAWSILHAFHSWRAFTHNILGVSTAPCTFQVEVDEETYQALLRLKAIKAQYREDYRELQMVKSEVEYTTRLLDSCSSEMSAAFEQW